MTPDRPAAIRAEFEAWYVAEFPQAKAPVWLPNHRRYEWPPHSFMMIGWEGARAYYCDGEATGGEVAPVPPPPKPAFTVRATYKHVGRLPARHLPAGDGDGEAPGPGEGVG